MGVEAAQMIRIGLHYWCIFIALVTTITNVNSDTGADKLTSVGPMGLTLRI